MPDLFPYQQTGAHFLATAPSKGRLLADEPGLGKTAQAIAACDEMGARSVVVIAPASVREHWRREFEQFGKSGLRPVVVTWQDVSDGVGIKGKFDVMIADESHFAKGHESKRTRVLYGEKCDGVGGLVSAVGTVMPLSGTPTPNHPAEIWPMLRALYPEGITHVSGRPMARTVFENRYCKFRDTGFGLQIVGGKNLGELRERLAPFVLRRKKADVLKDLPPIRFAELPLSSDFRMPPEIAALIPDIESAIEADGIAGLAKIAPHVASLRRITGLAKVNPVSEWIKDQLDGGMRKLVVFAHHREVLQALTVDAARHGFDYACITGDTTNRQAEVDRFQHIGSCRLFFGQIQAAGTGITLTAASDCVLVESDWTPANNEQAVMRIHRVGQNSACLVRVATLAGSIDERIQRAVMRKLETIDQLWN